jgi:rod shape-determining protein MreD
VKTVGWLLLLAFAAEMIRYVLFGRFTAQPDLLLGIVVVAALRLPPPRGAVVGLCLGLLRDLMAGNPIGTEALPITLVAWGVGMAGRTVYREAFVTHALMTFGAGLLKALLTYGIVHGDLSGLPWYFVRIALPSALLTAILVPLGDRSLRLGRNRRTGWTRNNLRTLREYEKQASFKR